MLNVLLPVLIASTPHTGLLDCETYNWLMDDLKFPDVSLNMKQDIVETIKDGTDPGCFKDAKAD
tara:strand:+ start:2221 stop:2412 length:192 start_codon:yes stop_codon:yes gene_type:complete